MIASVLEFLYPDLTIGPNDSDDVTVLSVEGVETIIWRAGIPEPTTQELTDAANDLTTVNGKVFSEWEEENGADPVKTRMRKAREFLDNNPDAYTDLLIALAEVVKDEINVLRAIALLPDRTTAQLKTAIKNKLTG